MTFTCLNIVKCLLGSKGVPSENHWAPCREQSSAETLSAPPCPHSQEKINCLHMPAAASPFRSSLNKLYTSVSLRGLKPPAPRTPGVLVKLQTPGPPCIRVPVGKIRFPIPQQAKGIIWQIKSLRHTDPTPSPQVLHSRPGLQLAPKRVGPEHKNSGPMVPAYIGNIRLGTGKRH